MTGEVVNPGVESIGAAPRIVVRGVSLLVTEGANRGARFANFTNFTGKVTASVTGE